MKKNSLLLIMAALLLFLGGTAGFLMAWCPDAKFWDKWEAMGGGKRETFSMYQEYLKTKITPTSRPPNVATGLAPLILNIEP
ncbi:MAG: hypothetical protein AAB019_02195, partial [Planctomycetota bacterium]